MCRSAEGEPSVKLERWRLKGGCMQLKRQTVCSPASGQQILQDLREQVRETASTFGAGLDDRIVDIGTAMVFASFIGRQALQALQALQDANS